MALASLEMTRKMKRRDPEAYQRLVKRLFCNELDTEFEESDFIYEPESSRKDSTGCLTGIKRAKSQDVLQITESRVTGLYQVIEYLGLDRNVREEGIFRKSGSLKKQQDLMERIDKGEEINLVDGEFTTHECASVLKTFLGNLPEPLVTNSCYLAHLQVAFLPDNLSSQEDNSAVAEKQIFCTQLLLELIPEEYFKLLKDLLFLLHGVCQREEENKMSSTNLGVIFCTHILSPRSMPPRELQTKLGVLTNATTFLIENPSILFTLPEKLLAEVQSFQFRRNSEGRRSLSKRSSQGGPGVECLIANTVFSFIPMEMEEGAAGEKNEEDDEKESNFVCDQLESTITSQFNLNIEIMNIKK
eukprot:GFUD01049644.1.p1 GENE.GFUD01049644.1~~GFUD01049644.1.p1  ORF type:complete len:358 (-),score=88.31 GFUD01049644.1:5-1078(-)